MIIDKECVTLRLTAEEMEAVHYACKFVVSNGGRHEVLLDTLAKAISQAEVRRGMLSER